MNERLRCFRAKGWTALLRTLFAIVVIARLVSRVPADAAENLRLAPMLAPIATFVQAANTGDRTKLVGAFSSDSAIVDEFAPFRFPAPGAAGHWYDGFGADQQANGVTNAVIAVMPAKFLTVAGRQAYVVVPTVYTYRIHGKPAKETGSLAFTLVQRGPQWKIGTMSWAKIADTSQP
jgi:hypothetical protein